VVNPRKVSVGCGAPRLLWHRSQECGGEECVEVAATDTGVTMRNSGDPATTLTFTPAEWLDFVVGIKAGDFDELSGVSE
jgi:hypothetical protein